MSYQVSYRKSFEKDLKDFKKNKQVLGVVKDTADKILANPSIGELLKGSWKGSPSMLLAINQN